MNQLIPKMNTVVYHLFCKNDGLDRFYKTYNKIENSNLLNVIDSVHVNCVGLYKKEWSDKISSLKKVRVHQNEYDKSEVTTVNLAKDLASKNLSGNTLYLHSKGATNKWSEGSSFTQKKECIDAWVDFMEYHVIENYQLCLNLLKEYDTCGCNKAGTYSKPFGFERNTWHYSGNFWWARNQYLNSIPFAKKDHYLWSEALFISGINAELGKHKEIARSEHVWPQILTNKLNPQKYRK
jgi:hypothetical protein